MWPYIVGVLSGSADLVPNVLVQFWKPVVKHLHHIGATPALLHKLVASQTEDDTLKNRLLVGWAAALLSAISPSGRAEQKQLGVSGHLI